MERKERRHHTREFKLEAVRLAAVGDKTKAKVARELGIRVNQLRQWRLDFEEEERNGVPKQELATAEQDLGALRRENARLRTTLQPALAESEVTHVSWTVPDRHNDLKRSVSWNARNAGTIRGSSSSRRCGWLPLEIRPKPRWRGNLVFG